MNRTFYTKKPEDFSPKVEVVSIFFHVGDNILLLKRNPNKPFGGTWCLPGGKLDPGEDVKEGLIREFAEETTIALDNGEVDWINSFYVRAPEIDYVFHVCRAYAKEMPQNIVLREDEHEKLVWVTIDQALEYELIPGEAECIKRVYKS